jgi:hypothetical protein
MAGTEHGDQFKRRRFITRHDVEDAAASGQPIRLKERDVVTSEAAQRAADLGVAIERDGVPAVAFGSSAATSASTAPSAAGPVSRSASAADLRHAVRAAVLAELGSEPPGLDAVIDRVLKSRKPQLR